MTIWQAALLTYLLTAAAYGYWLGQMLCSPVGRRGYRMVQARRRQPPVPPLDLALWVTAFCMSLSWPSHLWDTLRRHQQLRRRGLERRR